MSRFNFKVPGLVGNGNTTNSLPLPPGLDYIGFNFGVGGTVTAAQISNIHLFGDGDLLIDIASGTHLDEMNKFDKLTAFGGTVLRLTLEMLNMKRPEAQLTTTLNVNVPGAGPANNGGGAVGVAPGLAAYTNARLEWDCAGATSPEFQANLSADADQAGATGAGAVRRIKKFVEPVANGAKGITRFGFGTAQLRFWRRFFFLMATGGSAISRVRILAGSERREVWNRTKTVNDRILTDTGLKTPGSYWHYVLDFTETGMAELFDTISEAAMEVEVTADTAENCTIYQETIGSK